jgi:prepilin-type N-terminal cleavage/methylation domain-containing protein
MRKSAGFTLTEVIVVIGVFAILISFGVPAYSRWKSKHDVEADIHRLYGDLQFARMKAYSEKVVWGVWWLTSPFSGYQVKYDANNDGDVNDDAPTDNVVSSVTLKNPVTRTGASNSTSFDGRGFCNLLLSFYIVNTTGAATDCVALSKTRIELGKWDGADCIPR